MPAVNEELVPLLVPPIHRTDLPSQVQCPQPTTSPSLQWTPGCTSIPILNSINNIQKIFSTSYSRTLRTRLNSDSFPQHLINSSFGATIGSSLSTSLNEMNQTLDAYYERVQQAQSQFKLLWLLFVLIFLLTFGLGIILVIILSYYFTHHMNQRLSDQFVREVKPKLKQILERENVKLKRVGLELVGQHKRVPFVSSGRNPRGRRRRENTWFADVYEIELFSNLWNSQNANVVVISNIGSNDMLSLAHSDSYYQQ